MSKKKCHGIVLEGLIGKLPITIKKHSAYSYVLNGIVWIYVTKCSSNSEGTWYSNFKSSYEKIKNNCAKFEKTFIALVCDEKIALLEGKELVELFKSNRSIEKAKLIYISEEGRRYLFSNSWNKNKTEVGKNDFPKRIIGFQKCALCGR